MKWINGVQAAALLFLLITEGYAGDEGNYNANVYYGDGAGFSLPRYESVEAGRFNVLVGYGAGYHFYRGDYNVFYGAESAFTLIEGEENVIIGAGSAYNLQKGSQNVFVGTESGYNAADLNGSVFIGYRAGYGATRSNTLYIANSDTDNPLIYGEFDTGRLRINGDFNVTGETTFINGDVTVRENFTAEGDLNVSGIFQSARAAIHGDLLLLSKDIKGPDSRTLLTLEQYNPNPIQPSDVSLVMRNAGPDSFKWVIRTLETQGGLALSKVGSGVLEMTLTPADGPNGLQILMGDGGKYANGQWLDASSLVYKENIRALGEAEALTAFDRLQPVHYNYKTNKNEPVIGFIAEEVPDLVAPRDHKSLSALEMTALLAKVVRVQEKDLKIRERKIAELKRRQQRLRRTLHSMKELLHRSDLHSN